MGNMSEDTKEEAAPSTQTAEMETNLSEIIGEVVSPESETPELAAEPEPVADTPEEPVLSQDEEVAPVEGAAKEESGDGDLSPDVQRAIDKRIAKAVAKQKTAEERASEAEARLDELSGQLEELKDRPSLANDKQSKDSPVTKAKSLEELHHESQRAEQLLDWSDDMLMKLKSDPDGVSEELRKQKVDLRDQHGEEDYSSEQMDIFLSGLRRSADRTLRRDVPERKGYLEAKEVSDARAKEIFPWMEDEGSQLYKDAQDVMNTLPEIERLPHHKTAAGVFALGLEQLRQIESEQKSNRAKSSEPPSVQPGAPAAAPPVEPNAAPDKGNDALKSWSQTGNEGDFDKFIGTLID
jgi:hypothetical protein